MDDRRQRRGGLTNGLDPAVEAWRKSAAENRAALTAKQRRDRARDRVRYDFDQRLKLAVQAMAKRKFGTSASQLAALLLLRGLVELMQEEAVYAKISRLREPSGSLRLEWNYELDENALAEIDAYLDECERALARREVDFDREWQKIAETLGWNVAF